MILFLISTTLLAPKVSGFLYWFQQIDTIQEKVAIVKNISGLGDMSECANQCILAAHDSGHGCAGTRFEDNICQLVKYDAGRDFEPNGLYPPGNVSVLWRMQYSPDKCYINFRGSGNYGQVKDFCGRFGGKIPEARSLVDLDRMAEAAQGSPIHLYEDPEIPDRWLYMSDGTEAPPELSPTPVEGDPDKKCARWFYEDLKIHRIKRWSCKSRIGFMCHICG